MRQGRHREVNLREAKEALLKRLQEAGKAAVAESCAKDRSAQVGSGMRGDKTTTIRLQDDRATNHVTGKTMSATRYMKGQIDEIW